jgi:Ran GTPase-activating protein (RanGAP) involved in mRNA processing and transport
VIRDCDGLAQLLSLRSLYFTDCNLKQLRNMAALSSLVGLCTLHLRSCDLSSKLRSLASTLKKMVELTSLELPHNDIGAAGATLLAPILARMTKLTSLDLGDNDMKYAGAAALAPSLVRMKSLKSLDLSRNTFKAVVVLTPALEMLSEQLTSLDLSFNYIATDGAVLLAPALARMTKLTSLSLAANHIAHSLAPTLAPMAQLTSLNLSYNSFAAAPLAQQR